VGFRLAELDKMAVAPFLRGKPMLEGDLRYWAAFHGKWPTLEVSSCQEIRLQKVPMIAIPVYGDYIGGKKGSY
jgi:hypothetical protein